MIDGPLDIVLRGNALTLTWPDAGTQLSAALLRQQCRCAECVQADVGDRNFDGITLTGAEAVGHYALRLFFSDTHARGIYPWELLRSLAVSTASTSGK